MSSTGLNIVRHFKATFGIQLLLSVALIIVASCLLDSVHCDAVVQSQANPLPPPSSSSLPSPSPDKSIVATNPNATQSNSTKPNASIPNLNQTISSTNVTGTATVLPSKPSEKVPVAGGENKDVADANKTIGKTDESKAVEQEHNNSMAIFFVLCVIALGILLIHTMLETGFQYLPESIVVVFLGALIGLLINLLSDQKVSNWKREQVFSPTAFFLVLLPPIIFESGYNLHKGNFFQNIGSILAFAIVGTTISAFTIGTGIYILGLADVAYQLNFVESFAFGSLISAVDPVATVAIFHAIDVDPVLNMLVFGESILNDAIAIVLTTTISRIPDTNTGESITYAFKTFFTMFFASAGIGMVFALISALLLKHIDLRKHPSLEFGLMLVFTYAPYVLAEGIHLSGIMAILFCGIVMSHYTHFNLSTVTQITMQQTMRTLSFIAETCVFAYLGLAIFSFDHRCELALVIWGIVLCLLGRAANIFPLACLVNKFREHKITNKMQFVMWFSGLRGAISYALSLHLEFSSEESRRVMITTTLIIVLFTTLVFGGSTMPLLKYLQPGKKSNKRLRKRSSGRRSSISLSKTREWGHAIDSEHLSEYTEDDEAGVKVKLGGFALWDTKYLKPFFTRRFTTQELHDCKSQMTDLTNKWYQAIRVSPEHSDEEDLASAASTLPIATPGTSKSNSITGLTANA